MSTETKTRAKKQLEKKFKFIQLDNGEVVAGKFCPRCQEEKPLKQNFGFSSKQYQSYCKPCTRAYSAEKKEQNRKKSMSSYQIMIEQIRDGKYKNDDSSFKDDLIETYNLQEHPKAQSAYDKAWAYGNATGLLKY